jgi:hypothetical protein
MGEDASERKRVRHFKNEPQEFGEHQFIDENVVPKPKIAFQTPGAMRSGGRSNPPLKSPHGKT